MSALGRWNTVDPLVNKYYSFIVYEYVVKNTVNTIDPDGKDFILTIGRNDKGEITNFTFTATVYTEDKACYDAAQRAAKQWNSQGSETVNIGGLFSKLFGGGGKVKVDVQVSVKKVESKNCSKYESRW